MKSLSQMLADPRGGQSSELDADHRPPSPAYLDAQARGDQMFVQWCELPAHEQVERVEARSFEMRLQNDVQRRADDGWSHDMLETGYQRAVMARRRFLAQKKALAQDVPCKSWHERVEPGPMRDVLIELWRHSVKEWIASDPVRLAYLASPSAPCECLSCSPSTFRMRRALHNDDFGPLEYPEAV